MAIELTPDVSPESGGFGFQVPVFRMNQGVNAATANPLSRGAMQQPMDMVSESQFGLDPNVMATAEDAVRQQFYAGIDELNQFVNKAAQLGIDPSKVDMTSPESFALNQEFRKMTQSLQQKARDIQSGAAQKVYAQNQQAEQRRIQDQKMQEDLYNMQIGGLKEQQEDRKRKKLEGNIRADLGGDIFEKQRDYILSQSNQGINRGDEAGLNELKTVTRTQLEKAKKVSQKYIDDPDALQYISPLIEFYEGVLSGERIILNTNQPTGTKAPAGLDYLAGLAQNGQLEESVTISPAYSRVKRFGETNVISKGAFGLKDKTDRGSVDVVGFEDGFVYLDKNKERIPVRKSEVVLYPKNIRLMPATLAIGRTKISAPEPPEENSSVSEGKKVVKPKEERTAEVSFVLSDQERRTMISKGYSNSEAGMTIKQFLLGGGEVAPRSKNKFEEGLLNR